MTCVEIERDNASRLLLRPVPRGSMNRSTLHRNIST
jgi:hypothetical protein